MTSHLPFVFPSLGSSQGSLSVHPDRNHIVYPLGNTVIVENLNSKKQDFLQGHTNTVTCVTISRSGRFIASGQQTHMGFKVWQGFCSSSDFTIPVHDLVMIGLTQVTQHYS